MNTIHKSASVNTMEMYQLENVELPALEELKTKFSNQKQVSVQVALRIIREAQNLLDQQDNIIQLRTPVIVYGDIHGQFFDLINFVADHDLENLKKNAKQILFLGDYVDRGAFSCEVMLYLYRLKIEFPDFIHLLRGNHESEAISSFYGFRVECRFKYGLSLYYHFVNSFRSLPLAAVVASPYGRFLCLHGGLSPEISTLHDIQSIDRKCEPMMKGALCDLLWADPIPEWEDDDMELLDRWKPNSIRGCSYHFGYSVVFDFLERNNLISIVRGHELQEKGYFFHFTSRQYEEFDPREDKTIPPVITVFSAPNYCDHYDNLGAYLHIPCIRKDFRVEQHRFALHPDPLPLHISKSLEIESEVKKFFPYIPASKEFFDKLVETKAQNDSRATVKDLSSNMNSKCSKFVSPRIISQTSDEIQVKSDPGQSRGGKSKKRILRSHSEIAGEKLSNRSRSSSSEMHPRAIKSILDEEVGKWISGNSDNTTPSPSEIVTCHLRRLVNPVEDRTKVFSPKELEIIKLMFELMDVNGRTYLGSTEIKEFVRNILGEEITEEEGDIYVSVMDLDQDGCISFTDLLNCVAILKDEYQEDAEKWKKIEKKVSLESLTPTCQTSAFISSKMILYLKNLFHPKNILGYGCLGWLILKWKYRNHPKKARWKFWIIGYGILTFLVQRVIGRIKN